MMIAGTKLMILILFIYSVYEQSQFAEPSTVPRFHGHGRLAGDAWAWCLLWGDQNGGGIGGVGISCI